MPSPFPGMNPYLESQELWAGLHHRLISALANAIESKLSFDYRVEIEKRIYTLTPEDAVLIGIPDVAVLSQTRPAITNVLPTTDTAQTVLLPMSEEIRESYLEIRDVKTAAVITVIEVLSPTNKRPGKGRNAYETKRNAILESATHLVEIDLLREGEPMTMLGSPASDYRVLVSRAVDRPKAQLYAFNLQQPIPIFLLPLKPTDADLAIDLQNLLLTIYDQARYDLAIDYQQNPLPALKLADQTWMNALLIAKGLRSPNAEQN